MLAWAPPSGSGAEGGGTELDWLVDAPWGTLMVLFVLAIAVVAAAKYLGKSRSGGRAAWRKVDFDLEVAKLDALPVTAIAQAKQGPVHVAGVLREGEGTLGTGEHACVYQNRAKSSRAAAIAAELVMLDDGTEMVGLVSLEAARVIAPTEDRAPQHDIFALYLGDRVEVVGQLSLFDEPSTAGGRVVRGTLGALGQIQVRVVERPPHRLTITTPSASAQTPSAETP